MYRNDVVLVAVAIVNSHKNGVNTKESSVQDIDT